MLLGIDGNPTYLIFNTFISRYAFIVGTAVAL